MLVIHLLPAFITNLLGFHDSVTVQYLFPYFALRPQLPLHGPYTHSQIHPSHSPSLLHNRTNLPFQCPFCIFYIYFMVHQDKFSVILLSPFGVVLFLVFLSSLKPVTLLHWISYLSFGSWGHEKTWQPLSSQKRPDNFELSSPRSYQR